MRYQIISTGSKGNAVVIGGYILIDCGVPFKSLQAVCEDIKIVLLTHIHGDHFKPSTIRRLAKEYPALRFGCCDWLVSDLVKCGVSKRNIDVYDLGKIYHYKNLALKVNPIKLYHDVPQCGYRLNVNGQKVIYATDTAHLEGITARDYDLYMIEANYTDDDLQERIQRKQADGGYIYEHKVAYRHLSKEQADAFIYSNMGDRSEYVYLHEHKEEE